MIKIKCNAKPNGIDESSLIPVKIVEAKTSENLIKPTWLKTKLPVNSTRIKNIKNIIYKNKLHSVCKEASCPNLAECFHGGTATFMILGKICTRNCPFCDVTHGRPNTPDTNEPKRLAQAINDMELSYVVITSVDRDDLRDGGAQHFVDCINEIRAKNPNIRIEILVPDFRGCMSKAIKIITSSPPDIFNHNLENVPRLYKQIKPGANYNKSLELLKNFKSANPNLPTKSGLIMGLGETNTEIIDVMLDLRKHNVTMLTIGQYLQPTIYHLPVKRYVSPQEFYEIKQQALSLGFTYAACGPLVRSSYHAGLQYIGVEVT